MHSRIFLFRHTDIKNQHTNHNNGDMLHATIHAGFILWWLPYHHITIVEIHMLILDIWMCI